jgi:hypothetical protein
VVISECFRQGPEHLYGEFAIINPLHFVEEDAQIRNANSGILVHALVIPSPRHPLEIPDASCIHDAQHVDRIRFPIDHVEDGAKIRHRPAPHVHFVGL